MLQEVSKGRGTAEDYLAVMRQCQIEGAPGVVAKVFGDMAARGLRPAAPHYTAAIATMQRVDHVEAERLLREMRARGIPPFLVAYNSVLVSKLRACRYEEMPALVEELKREGLTPDLFTYNTLAATYPPRGDVDGLLRMIGDMRAAGFDPDLHTKALLVGALAYARRKDEALRLLGELKSDPGQPNNLPHLMMLKGLEYIKDWACVVEVWDDFRATHGRYLIPTPPMVKAVLNAYAALSRSQAFLSTFDEMREDWDMTATPFQLRGAAFNAAKLKFHERVLALSRELVERRGQMPGWQYLEVARACLALRRMDDLRWFDQNSPYLDPIVKKNNLIKACKGLEHLTRLADAYMTPSLAAPGTGTAASAPAPTPMQASTGGEAQPVGVKGVRRGKDLADHRAGIVGALSIREWEQAWALLDEARAELTAAGRDPSAFELLLQEAMASLVKRGAEDEELAAFLDTARGRGIGREALGEVCSRVMEACGRSDCPAVGRLLRLMKDRGVPASARAYCGALYQAAIKGRVAEAEAIDAAMRADNIPRNIYSYHALLLAAAEAGREREIRRLLEAMEEDGIPPIVVTYNIVLKSYSKTGDWKGALDLMRTMESKGVAPDEITFNTAIFTFLKAPEAASRALELVDEMKRRGIPLTLVTYNFIIEVCDRARLPDKVAALWTELKERGFQPDERTFNTMARTHESANRLADLRACLGEALASGLEASYIRYLLIRGLLRERRDKEAEEEAAQWGAANREDPRSILVRAAADVDRFHDALAYVRSLRADGLKPSQISYSRLLAAYRRAGRLEDLQGMLEEMEASGVTVPPMETLKSYVTTGDWRRGLALIGRMQKSGTALDLNHQNIRLTLLRMAKDAEGCAKVLKEMVAAGVTPNGTSYMHAIMAAVDAGERQRARNLVQQAKNVCGDSPQLASARLYLERKRGKWQQALESVMTAASAGESEGSFNTIMAAFLDNEQWDRCIEAFEHLKKKGVRPHQYIIYAVIVARGHVGDWKGALRGLQELKDYKLTARPGHYQAVLMALARSGRAAEAQKVWDQMVAEKVPIGHVMYHSLIMAYSRSGNIAKAVGVLPLMRGSGLTPDVFTYNTLLNGCGLNKFWKKAVLLLREMEERGLRADQTSCAAVVDACSREWPVALYMHEEFFHRIPDRSVLLNSLRVLLRWMEPPVFDLFAGHVFREAVRGDKLEPVWRGSADGFMVDLHYCTRPMARAALRTVMDDAISGKGEVYFPGSNLIVVTGQGHRTLGSGEPLQLRQEVDAFFGSFDPPVPARSYENNPGRVVVVGDDMREWVKEYRARSGR
jgi:pentatricopeptide repeat protein